MAQRVAKERPRERPAARPEPETILYAAIREDDGTVYAVPRPGRHHDVIASMASAGRPTPIQGEVGFMSSRGRFLDRKSARIIAVFTDALLPNASDSDELYTEDVW